MDKEIYKALKERGKLIERLREIDRFLSAYESFSGTKVDRNDTHQDENELLNSRIPQQDLLFESPRKLVPAEIANLAEQLIRQNWRPMTRGELVEAIETKGFEIRSLDKNRYIGTILWRNHKRFSNLDGRGYWATSLGDPPIKDVEQQYLIELDELKQEEP